MKCYLGLLSSSGSFWHGRASATAIEESFRLATGMAIRVSEVCLHPGMAPSVPAGAVVDQPMNPVSDAHHGALVEVRIADDSVTKIPPELPSAGAIMTALQPGPAQPIVLAFGPGKAVDVTFSMVGEHARLLALDITNSIIDELSLEDEDAMAIDIGFGGDPGHLMVSVCRQADGETYQATIPLRGPFPEASRRMISHALRERLAPWSNP